jgi:hypothetical protein
MTCPHCTDADTDNPMVLKLRLSELRRERDHYRDCISAREVRRIVDERDKALADLAAARALLREARPYLVALDNRITHDGPMRESVRELWNAIDAALKGE